MKIKNVNDYVDEVHKKFDKLDREEIRKILMYGFKIYNYINYYGGDVILTDKNILKFLMYTGKLYNNFERYYSYYLQKMKTKLRILDKRKKEKWDGYYYFGLTSKMYEQLEEQINDDIIMLDNVMLFRLEKELKIHNQYKYFYKIKYPKYKGYSLFMPILEIEKSKLIKI